MWTGCGGAEPRAGLQAVLARPEAAILDICCGTGDLTMALLKLRPHGATPILAGDFSPAMLRRGAEKFGPKANRESRIGGFRALCGSD